MKIKHVCKSCSLIVSVVIPYFWTCVEQKKFLQIIVFIYLVSLRKIVVLNFYSFNIGNERDTWVCWQFSRIISIGIELSILSKLKAVDSKLFFPFSFHFLFSFSFQIVFLSTLKTMIRVTRSCGPTSVTLDDMVTGHKMHKRM